MVEEKKDFKMEYRYLGNTGLQVSVLSFGKMLENSTEEDYIQMRDQIKHCMSYGVNYFDTAEAYGMGEGETVMGRALKEINPKRESIVVSTKLYRSGEGPNDKFMSRKHIIDGMNASLKRLQLEYVDVVFSHRPDFETPLEETVKAFNTIINSGKAFYWATSEWPADMIARAIEMCKAKGWHQPVADQCEYNILCRDRPEKEYRRLFSEFKYGTTVWSPLAMGILSGKYNDGEMGVEGSRFGKFGESPILKQFWMKYFGPTKKDATIAGLKKLAEIAKELGTTQPVLALAWVIASHDVSTCILGFSRLSQIDENMQAIELARKWTPETEKKIRDALTGGEPMVDINFRSWVPLSQRRDVALTYQ